MDGVLASHPAAPGSIPSVPDFFIGKKFDVTEVYDGAAAQSSGQQRLENVDQTHLVLVASTTYIKNNKNNNNNLLPYSQNSDKNNR